VTTENAASPWTTTLAWTHAVLFGAIALACYASPETVFGTSAWLQMPRFAVQLFAAALAAFTILLIGSARAGSPAQLRLALLAAVVIDVQVPILSFSQPAALEHFESGLGIPWFIVPLLFAVMVGLTAPLLTRKPSGVAGA
jgi:hypothetical protein